MRQLKVSSSTSTKKLSGCLATCVENNEDIELRAVGAGAVNQMYKSMAIASGLVATKGLTLMFKAGFDNFDENGENKTALIARVVVK